jgi:hypothetical protein
MSWMPALLAFLKWAAVSVAVRSGGTERSSDGKTWLLAGSAVLTLNRLSTKALTGSEDIVAKDFGKERSRGQGEKIADNADGSVET